MAKLTKIIRQRLSHVLSSLCVSGAVVRRKVRMVQSVDKVQAGVTNLG